ncbi:MAG: HNH endonuclease signature motif containing protein [Acidimicrobiales bacterium]
MAICTPGWSEAHRNVSYATENLVASRYGLSSHYGYEIDHLIPLELGGANDVSNLWPEPYDSPAGAHQKDGLEDYLHDQVCYHGLALATAQHEASTDWYAAWVAAGKPMGFTSTGPPASAPPRGSAHCTVSVAFNSGYGDYDVYVHSNEPDESVSVEASGGATASWHTDRSGYADVYLKVPGSAPGQRVIARLGGGSCTTTIS